MEIQVEFLNRKGKRLRGVIHRPRLRAARRVPGVVFFHGFTGDRMESHWIFVKCARALEQAGIASLRFDFYGSGESEGTFREVTLHGEIADAKVAVEFFRKQKGIRPEGLGLCGLSMGGAVAASVAKWSKARALVLWSALAHPKELRDIAEHATRMLPDGNHEYNAHEVSARFLDEVDRVEPVEALRKFHSPTLILHPEKDEHLPLHHPDDLFRACAAEIKEKVIIPGADHTFTSVAWENEVIARTTQWFARHLTR